MNLQMQDAATQDRRAFIDSVPRPESAWWWAVGVVSLALFFMLAAYVGPVVFPAG